MKQEIVLELFDRYADIVYRVALSYLRSPQEAEDVVQTVFLKLLEGGMIVYPGKERAFLTKVTINHCKNFSTQRRSMKLFLWTKLFCLYSRRIGTYFMR